MVHGGSRVCTVKGLIHDVLPYTRVTSCIQRPATICMAVVWSTGNNRRTAFAGHTDTLCFLCHVRLVGHDVYKWSRWELLPLPSAVARRIDGFSVSLSVRA